MNEQAQWLAWYEIFHKALASYVLNIDKFPHYIFDLATKAFLAYAILNHNRNLSLMLS